MSTNERDSLGDRMKRYEQWCQPLMPMLPIIARLDGKAFHTFTRGLQKPFDADLTALMRDTTRFLVEESNARIGYTQSDEITLIWHAERPESEIFFSGKPFKMASVLAAMASVHFNRMMPSVFSRPTFTLVENRTALFDCRVWSVPNRAEAVNCLIWREQDAVRNSISSAAQSVYSHKELHEKTCDQMQEMLFAKGINWNDYPAYFKRGSYVRRVTTQKPFTVEEIANLPPLHNARKNPSLVVERSYVDCVDITRLTRVTNREEVVFDGAVPIIGD